MTDALNALKAAAIEALKADAALSALVARKVYEEAPRDERGDPTDAHAPFVYLVAFTWRRIELGCNPGYRVAMRFNAVSTKFGHEQARAIIDAVRHALDGASLALASGHAMDQLRAESGGDVIAPLTAPRECFVEFSVILSDATPYEG